MFRLRETDTAKFKGKRSVMQAESEAIAIRRRNQNITDNTGFSSLGATLDIPEEQRSPVLNSLLDKLNDPLQCKCWEVHATKHPERGGMGNFFGLALSGGGIRSATFNLGILQVLAWTRLLQFVDYLSTVSGGGYIGSCVSSMFASPLKHFPFEHRQGTIEGTIFRHLRNNAEYLAPGGAVDYLRIPMTVIRGMVINLLVIAPYLLFAACLTAAMHPTRDDLAKHWFNAHIALPAFLGNSFIVTKVLLLSILGSFVLFPIVYVFLQKVSIGWLNDWSVRNKFGRALGVAALLTAFVAFIELQPIAIGWMFTLRDDHGWNIGLISGAITGVQAMIPTAISVWLMKNANKVVARHALTFLGLSALVAFWSLYLWMSVAIIERGLANESLGLLVPLIVAGVLILYGVGFVDVNHTSVHSFYRDRLSKAYVVKQVSTPGGMPKIVTNDRQLLSKLNTDDAPYHLINAAINLKATKESYRNGRHAESFIFSRYYVGSEATGYCHTENMESQSRNLNLATAMAISGAAAAPNMGKQSNRLFSFFMAMLNVRLNYWLPNPRYALKRSVSDLPRSPLRRVGPLYLVRELFGWLDDTSANVNLSDGGHFENLALYELFRRECRFIICGDGEADSHLNFNGLAEALRMVQIDFGIIVEMQGLDAIRAGQQNHAIGKIRYSDDRIGWLLYLKQSLRGDDSLSATLDAERFASSKLRSDCSRYDDNPYIAEYKGKIPEFPHQSTGDQFFDEAQFECTRAVGYNVAYRTLCR